MDPQTPQRTVWSVSKAQHGRIARWQLLELGLHPDAIKHRVARGKLHRVRRGVYAVGRPDATRHGRWMEALLSCGPGAVLSHASAAALWEIHKWDPRQVEVSVSPHADPRPAGIRVHRRRSIEARRHRGIPVTSAIDTIIDLAPRLSRDELEGMISQADILGLTTPRRLRKTLDTTTPRPGVKIVRDTLDPHLFRLTRSKLERLFLPLCARAGLPRPLTRQWVNGYEVDFYWPDIRWVVETDGGTFHRTPMQQTKDRKRDQAHARAGLHCLRFTHWQVAKEPEDVEETLAICAARLSS